MPKKRKTVKKAKKLSKKVKRPAKGAKKRKAVKKIIKKTAKQPLDKMVKVGEVTHYFPHVKAAALLVLRDSIKVGDEIYIKGHTSDFKEKIVSLQLDREPIKEGKRGEEIGLLVKKRVRIGDSVFKL